MEYAWAGVLPDTTRAAFIAPNATLAGAVTLDTDVNIWYGAVVRTEILPLKVGAGTNIQDNAVLHTGLENPLTIGQRVTIGHSAIVHGCTVGDDVLIGMGAIVLNGAVIGEGAVIAAGAVVRENQVVPPRTLAAGIPAQIKGPVSDELLAQNRFNNAHYIALAHTLRDQAAT